MCGKQLIFFWILKKFYLFVESTVLFFLSYVSFFSKAVQLMEKSCSIVLLAYSRGIISVLVSQCFFTGYSI